jgi:PAS domain S-box-containing protein
MKLQEKTSIILVIFLIVILTLICIFVSVVSMSSYSALEQKYVLQDLDQAVSRLQDNYTSLSSIVADRGPWDDTYNFVNGNEPDYISMNLFPEAYKNLGVDLIVISNRQGQIVYDGEYDEQNDTIVAVPDIIRHQLTPSNPLLSMANPHNATTGILMVGGKPLIAASRPIVHTDYSGTPQGVVIMGKYLDDNEISYLSQVSKLNINLLQTDDPSIPASVLSSLRTGLDGSPGVVIPVNRSQIAGYALLRDVTGNDAFILEIEQPRDIYQEGITSTYQYILIVLGAGLLFGIVILLILDRLVLSRISSLSLQVHDIGNHTELSPRMHVDGNDEFSDLSREINRMLETIEKTHEGLLQSETRFRELAELLPQILFEMDTQGNLTYVNKAGAELFGITEPVIAKGVNIRMFLSPDNSEQMMRGLAAVMAGAPSPGDVYTLLRPGGGLMKGMVSTSLIRKEEKIIGFRGIVVDLTERTRLREELEESTKLLTNILQASPVGVYRLDTSGKVTYINDTFTRITGIPFEQIRGMYWGDILPKEERDRVLGEVGEAVRELRTSSAEARYIHPDGTPYWLFGQTVPFMDKEGKFTGWVGTITDITKQKLIEDALKESEEKYRAITENTPDILLSTDMDGNITYVSPQINKYGFLEEEVIGKPLQSFIHPADRKQVESTLSHELKEGAQFSSRFRILDKWGNPFWFEEKSTLRLDVSGKPIGIYGILRDVSERKLVEDAIEIANKKLNLMNQITRHDILNTITGLLGCVDMAEATNSPVEKEQLLNDIRELTRVIQRHITFTREYQEVGVHLPQWQNVNDIITRVLQNFSKSGIRFSTDFERVEIYADPLLEKVFYNLVDNAIRYGVSITTISIYPTISDRGFSLVFEDNGVGVEDRQKREIFKRGVGKNTGMGLFLTAEILAITGITIEENGVFGKGARFELRIPNGTWRLQKD